MSAAAHHLVASNVPVLKRGVLARLSMSARRTLRRVLASVQHALSLCFGDWDGCFFPYAASGMTLRLWRKDNKPFERSLCG